MEELTDLSGDSANATRTDLDLHTIEVQNLTNYPS
jgi:hypothetical protein